ncbi:MAG: PspC domain-containing protein [Chloroflexi bacterium]|nr:PspC domain-containing protein [Chloroflexota bacterium]
MNPRRLSRSRDRQLAGVAGGMAEYLDLDPTVVRILWVIVGIASGGLAILAYVILALVMPQATYAPAPGGWAAASAGTGATAGWGTPPPAPAWAPGWDAGASAEPRARPRTESRGLGAAAIIGVVLIVVGAIALADAALPGWVAGAILGPAVLLALGAALLVSSLRRRQDDPPAADSAQSSAPAPSSPASAGTAPTAASWEVADTQPADPADFGSTMAASQDETANEGSRPG